MSENFIFLFDKKYNKNTYRYKNLLSSPPIDLKH